MLPVSGAVTNNAPPGPTALPWSSSRPVTSRVVAGAAGELFAVAVGVALKISVMLRAKANTSLFQFMRLLLSIINCPPVLTMKSDGRPFVTVLCQFKEYSYNLPKLDDFLNTESDTKTGTNKKTCKKNSRLGHGFANSAGRWI
jgi:hypothetical protein